jgi:hypothetical protein
MEEMIRRGLSLGGEQSGHVIFSEYLFTGDGLATSLNVLRTMGATGRTLSELASELTSYPQVLLNVRVERKVDLTTVPGIAGVMSAVESRLAGNGRLLIRYSGTEPLLRIMIEGRDQQEIAQWAQEDCGRRQTASGGRCVNFQPPTPNSQGDRIGWPDGRSVIKLSVNVNKVATVRNSRGGADRSIGARGREGMCGMQAPGDHRASTSRRAPHHASRRPDRRIPRPIQRAHRVQHRRRSAA